MKQFFYKGIRLKVVKSRIDEVCENGDRYEIMVDDENSFGVTYYFPLISNFKTKPKKDDVLTTYFLGGQYYGMDLNDEPQFRANGVEEKEVERKPLRIKAYFFKGVLVKAKHEKIIEVDEVSLGYSLTFEDGYCWLLHFEQAKTVPAVGDIFTAYLFCWNQVIACDINGVPQFRKDGFEERYGGELRRYQWL